MADRIVNEMIDCKAVIDEVVNNDNGAVLTFAGTVRNTNLGRSVSAIDYHAYESMAGKEIEKLELDAECDPKSDSHVCDSSVGFCGRQDETKSDVR